MENTRKEFGKIRVKEPAKVIKIGMVYDRYKKTKAREMWAQADKKLKQTMPLLDTKNDIFFSESFDTVMGGSQVTIETRYYTPKSNIENADATPPVAENKTQPMFPGTFKARAYYEGDKPKLDIELDEMRRLEELLRGTLGREPTVQDLFDYVYKEQQQ